MINEVVLPRDMSAYRLTVLPGDGTGKEVSKEAQKILQVFQEYSPLDFDITEIPCGGEYYIETGKEWPDGSFEHCRDNSDAILLGAIGWPDAKLPNGDNAGGSVILGLRSGLDLYANIRPVKLYAGVNHKIHGNYMKVWDSKLVDMVLIRENTEGLYHSLLRRSALSVAGQSPDDSIIIEKFPGLEGEVAWDPRPISRKGSQRVIDFGFKLANRKMEKTGIPQKVTCVDKSNVTNGCRLFRKIFQEVASEYQELQTHEAYIDAFTMWLIRSPEDLDVVVLPNMFGDIATDLASVLQGGLGMAASANIGDNHMLFEPVHGSAPQHAGKNIVNPIAIISSIQLMFENLGSRHHDKDAILCADLLDRAISEHLAEGKIITYDLGGNASTSEVGTAIADRCIMLLKETFSD